LNPLYCGGDDQKEKKVLKEKFQALITKGVFTQQNYEVFNKFMEERANHGF
jgi:hypothetical protein